MKRVYCGIDFHKRTCTIAMKDGEGKSLAPTTKVHTDLLVRYLSNKSNLMIGIETSGGTNDMVQKLKACGHDVRLINSVKFRAVGLGGKKTDERDAETIAEYLRTNFVPEVFHKSQSSRELKSIIVMREHLVRSRTNTVNHVRGILREYGITMPVGFDQFLKNVSKSVDRVDNIVIREGLKAQVSLIHDFVKQEEILEDQLTRLGENSEEIKLLQTIPGVGLLGATIMIAVIDDITRFKNAKAFASYLGLVPSEDSSGDRKRLGSITRSGSEITRRYFIHGARAIISSPSPKMRSDPNRQWADRLVKAKGMNKATVALAHRLARIAFAVVRDKRGYRVSKYTQRPINEALAS